MAELSGKKRRAELIRLLSHGRPVVASELAKGFGCNEATVRRQLKAMRDEEGLPIVRDRVAGTYRFTQKVAEIPGMLVSVEDRGALLFSLQAAAQFEDTPVCAGIRRIYENLLATLPAEGATDFERMMKCVRFTGPRAPRIRAEVWQVLLLCLEAHETMRITYTDGYRGRVTQREIDPYGLLMCNRSWILVAYCHKSKRTLTFSPHRISEIESTDKTFRPPADFMDGFLADAFDGMQSVGEKSQVKLRIGKDAPKFVQERVWSEREVRITDKSGDTIVRFETPALFALEREILADAGWVEVLEPARTRERILVAAKQLAGAHGA